MKHVLLQFYVLDGEREHKHRVLFTTKCKNIEFSIYWYLFHYWGNNTYYDGNYLYSFGGEIAYKIIDYTLLTESEYLYLSNLFK